MLNFTSHKIYDVTGMWFQTSKYCSYANDINNSSIKLVKVATNTVKTYTCICRTNIGYL